MERLLGANCECIRGVDPAETLRMMHEVGFTSYFAGAHDAKNLARIKSVGDSLGMTIRTIHAPFDNINSLWMHGVSCRSLYKRILASIDAVADVGIPGIVLHVSSGWRPPEINDLGLSRYDAIVEYAADKGIKVAFENLRLVGNLAYLADRYRSVENVGFCYDFGHGHCYTPSVMWMDIFRNRLFSTHIHDNLGIKEEYEEHTDIHYLPFDGDMDYVPIMRALDLYGYTGDLTLEISNAKRPEYEAMAPIEFLRTAHERLDRLARL